VINSIENKLNTHAVSSQANPHITALSDVGWLTTFQLNGLNSSGNGVYSRSFENLPGGDKMINGTAAADTITFTTLSTTVSAGEGANTISGTSGNNLVIAGSGADTITFTSGNNTIEAGDGANTISATSGDNTITTGSGADTITVTSGDNTIEAGDGANTITATSGDNTITTGSGADTITTGGLACGDDIMTDGPMWDDFVSDEVIEIDYISDFDPSDRITIASRGNTIITGSGADTITVTSGDNTIEAGDGANTITATSGLNSITTGSGADTITTGGLAGIGNTINAGDGANTIATGAGNDIVYTGVDIDTITTGAGDDTIHITGGTDTIAAGAGNDTLIVDFSAATAAVSINALAGTAAAGYAGNISGLGIATFAGVENFEITSGSSNDTITTGAGNDAINAGGGHDVIFGGEGADIFVFELGSGNDIISDFEQGVDMIDVSGYGFANFNTLAINVGTENSVINFGAGNTVTVLDVVNLDMYDFYI
jgi:Ca2+-binding RTX toxin-like protein